MVYYLTRFAQWLARIVPRQTRWLLGGFITQLVYWVWREKRLATQYNMSVILELPITHPDVRRTARLSWRNYGHYVADFFDIPNHPRDYYYRFFTHPKWAPGPALAEVEQAKETGKGLFIASGHFGNWDLAGVFVAQRVPLYALADNFPDPRMGDLIQSQRRELGINIITIDEGLLPLMRLLRQGEVIATPIDRPVSAAEGIPIRFFGRTAYVPRGLGGLMVRSGAQIMPGFAWYQDSQTMCARIFPPVTVPRTSDPEADDIAATQVMFDALETMIRLDPTQWFMFRQFWPNNA